MRKFSFVTLVLAAMLCAVVAAGERPKNLIVMIADGTGNQQYTFARWWKGEPLHIEKHLTGSLRTHIADSVVADSAPAATALATGVRTNDKFIGIGAAGDKLLPGEKIYNSRDGHPVASVLEGARLLGKATGVVATCRVSHATPAGYYAHTHNRNFEDDITQMGVHGNLDVVLGGGGRHLLPRDLGGRRPDGENLEQVLLARGYTLVKDTAGLNAVTGGRLWGAFASNHMEPEIDRPHTAPDQPTLAQMTAKALEVLSANEKGFFLMVEGSQVDWANHANDPAYLISDLMAWDDACGVALGFAEGRDDTLVVMLSDHDTGGFTIGNYRTDRNYSQMKVEPLLDPIRRAGMSTTRMAELLGASGTVAEAREIVQRGWGVELSDADAGRILELVTAYGEDANWAFGEVLSASHTLIGWTTHGHVGGDVPIGAYGHARPEGVYDEPGFGRFCANILGLDLERLTERLFVDATRAFAGGKVEVSARPDANGTPVSHALSVSCNGRNAQFQANTNVMILDGKTIQLEGVCYYSQPDGVFYVPAQAAAMVTGSSASLPNIAK